MKMLQIIFTIAYIIGSLSLDFTTWEDGSAELRIDWQPSPYESCHVRVVTDAETPTISGIYIECVAS